MQPRLLRKQPIKALMPCIRLQMFVVKNNVHHNEIFPQKNVFLLYSNPFFPPSSLYPRSPALIGCFVVDRKYFEEIGLLDEGMEIYGGENVELGIRVSLHEKKKTAHQRWKSHPNTRHFVHSSIHPNILCT